MNIIFKFINTIINVFYINFINCKRERKINEFGGETHAYMYNDIVTITKCDVFGVVKEKIEKHIDEFEI